MARFVERMERRWRVVEIEGQPVGEPNPANWLITEVCLSHDMNADIAKLMKMAVGETVVGGDGDVYQRMI